MHQRNLWETAGCCWLIPYQKESCCFQNQCWKCSGRFERVAADSLDVCSNDRHYSANLRVEPRPLQSLPAMEKGSSFDILVAAAIGIAAVWQMRRSLSSVAASLDARVAARQTLDCQKHLLRDSDASHYQHQGFAILPRYHSVTFGAMLAGGTDNACLCHCLLCCCRLNHQQGKLRKFEPLSATLAGPKLSNRQSGDSQDHMPIHKMSPVAIWPYCNFGTHAGNGCRVGATAPRDHCSVGKHEAEVHTQPSLQQWRICHYFWSGPAQEASRCSQQCWRPGSQAAQLQLAPSW